MNKETLMEVRRKNKAKLDFAFGKKVNSVEVDINNTPRHEMMKTFVIYLLRKGVPANMLPMVCRWESGDIPISIVMMRARPFFEKYKHDWEVPEVSSEARFRDSTRADVYDHDDGSRIEIETDHRISKKDSITIYIH